MDGQVLDESNSPIADAEVTVRPASIRWFPWNQVGPRTTVTRANGSFSIHLEADDQARFTISKDGFQTLEVVVPTAFGLNTFHLRRGVDRDRARIDWRAMVPRALWLVVSIALIALTVTGLLKVRHSRQDRLGEGLNRLSNLYSDTDETTPQLSPVTADENPPKLRLDLPSAEQTRVLVPGEKDTASTGPPSANTTDTARPPLDIFISYRREDSNFATGRLYDRLSDRYGREHVFKDVDNMPLAADFRKHIAQRLERCDVILVIIGSAWLKAGTRGKRRLDDPTDFVRIEIETALKRGVPIVPVLVGAGAKPPPADKLPASIVDLAFRQAVHIRADPDFHADVDRLIAGLDSIRNLSDKGSAID